ncbi:mitochondrial carrier domain-containing protein [Mycena leptocephala]|nr:mitochondrial carrier domain-containing protein [Mycena leptocephala]
MSSGPQKKQPYSFWLSGASAHPLNIRGCNAHRPQGTDTTRTHSPLNLTKHQEDVPHRFWAYDENKEFLGAGKDAPTWKLALAGNMAGGIAGFVGTPVVQIVMVRLQGDFAKPPEKWFNYKNCFDALFRMVHEEGPSSLARGVGPNVFRAILMNASQLASYDFFKAELLKTRYFEDNIMCHFTASFAAVRF